MGGIKFKKTIGAIQFVIVTYLTEEYPGFLAKEGLKIIYPMTKLWLFLAYK